VPSAVNCPIGYSTPGDGSIHCTTGMNVYYHWTPAGVNSGHGNPPISGNCLP
jgi:hypothetical protein